MNLGASVHGCIDNEGKWTITQEDTVNRETFYRPLDKVIENYPEYQVFMLLADNAKYHQGDIIREHIYKLSGQGKNIKLVHFSRYSSNLNPIEQEWKSFKKEIHNKIIMVKGKLISTVTEGIASISTPKGLLSEYFPVLFGQN